MIALLMALAVVLMADAVAADMPDLRPDLRVLYTTGNLATEQMKALFVPSAHFLPKPYSDDQLRDSMHGLLAA